MNFILNAEKNDKIVEFFYIRKYNSIIVTRVCQIFMA